MVTSQGTVKKTKLSEFGNIRRTGIIAISLDKGDELSSVRLVRAKDEMALATKSGQSIRFKESAVRAMGRGAAGVRAIRLKKSDMVTGFEVIPGGNDKELKLLVVMANGYAKQTPLSEYKVQGRGGSGIRTATVTAKTGTIIASKVVGGGETELFALSEKGQIIRTEIAQVRTTGRAAQGVRIMSLDSGDHLAGIAVI